MLLPEEATTSQLEAAAPERIDVLGCQIDRLDMTETLERCDDIIASRTYAQHMAINAAKLVSMKSDVELTEIVNDCALVNADGQAVVWAAKFLGTPLPERVAGVDLMHELIARAEERGYRVYFLGAKHEVLEQAVANITARHPDLQVAGFRDGYFDESEDTSVAATIAATQADILFVAMPSPRKEKFLGRHGVSTAVPFVMGVGGSIDIEAGITRRAPRVWQVLGLEWLYRVYQEPRRMIGRYARSNGRFLALVLKQWLGSESPVVAPPDPRSFFRHPRGVPQ